MEEMVALAAVLCIFGWIPITAVYKAKIRLEELKALQHKGESNETQQALQELRREVQALRDTSTKFDMSFDAGLSRLEDRLNRVEQQQATAATEGMPVAGAPTVYAPTVTTEKAVLRNGHGG